MKILEIQSTPYTDQKSGTAGLRKKVAVFQQAHYLENFLQSIFDAQPQLRGSSLVIGGDGRYHNRRAIETAICIAVANGVKRIIVGQGGLVSTPACSHLIRIRDAAGGFLFTASHNPAGPDGDFGIKFNIAGGGQANEELTARIYDISRGIQRYRIADGINPDIDRQGEQQLGDTVLEVIDGVADYAALMERLFDFDQIRSWLASGKQIRFDAMHAVTGPYAQRLFVETLGADPQSVLNAVPLADFGGGHPDPNLIYAKDLVDLMMGPGAADVAAASDGDGDRNMILGRGIFISPGDSLAMLAAHLHRLPGYRQGLAGVARSMPTCRAVDRVAKRMGLPCYETPTGWKFFANLLDAGRITLCGEESFGTSSNHVREKDGVWAALAWINILAATGQSVAEIAQQHWQTYGRHYYARHDYEELPTDVANGLMKTLAGSLTGLVGKTFGEWTISLADEFAYTDPVDGSSTAHQGVRIVFGDAGRIVVRLSGTGTSGATLRVYLERFEQDAARLAWPVAQALQPLAALADQLVQISELTGRTTADVVT